MSDSVPEGDPTWAKFGEALRASRAPLQAPASPNQVAALLQRAELEAEAGASTGFGKFGKWALGLGGAAAVAAVVVGVVLTKFPSEEPWTATALVATNVQTVGSVTETAENGHALLALGADRIGVGPGTRVDVARASNRGTRLVLSKGTVAANVDHARGKRNFDVETPLGRVHVVGTVFRVSAFSDEFTVEVQEGVVEVTRASAVSRITKGQRLRVKAGVESVEVRTEGDFDELKEETPVTVAPPAPEPRVEAAPTEEPSEPESEPVLEEPKRRAVVSAAKISEWRRRAARGECGLVVAEVKRVLTVTPDDVGARMTLGDCQRRSGDKPAAVETYLRASSSRGAEANRALFLAASVLQDDLSKPERALTLLDRYLSRGPESRDLEASALVRKARALRSVGKTKQAATLIELVLKKFGDTSAAPEALRLRDQP